MLEMIASLSARERTADLARSALPDSPVCPEPVTPARVPRAAFARRRAGLVLRWLADLVEPTPCCGPAITERG